ncbi:MAG: hypoxanthine phosphoribosyltransferase [Prevotella sp.]|nr:hypoxanthine phosphoribosyltransferase [Prevotella sp.]
MAAERITILGKTFEKTIPEAEIQEAVKNVASRIKADYEDKNPVFLVVLNGAFSFAADLLRMLDFPCEYVFTKVNSYDGLASTGKVIEHIPILEDLTDRHVVVIEDIVETGYSMQFLMEVLSKKSPASAEICAFSFKPEKLLVKDLKVKYVGMQLPDDFIVGYGLDYHHQGRYLRDIYSLVNEE